MLVRPRRIVLPTNTGRRLLCRWNSSSPVRLDKSTHQHENPGVNLSSLAPSVSAKSQLERIIRDTIKATGPMSFYRYMQMCLSHPEHGYYMNYKNPIFGERGDFVTSPEISQIFGELIAIWHLSRWVAAGSPPEIRVIEFGPGRGTLMADALRTWAQFPECRSAIREVHLIETSPHLREVQAQSITDSSLKALKGLGRLKWHDFSEDISPASPSTFTMVIAHEFFDALPVHIVENCDDGWHDVLVSFVRSSEAQGSDSPLVLVRSPEASLSAKLLASSSPRFSARPIGSRLEISPHSFKIAREIAQLVGSSGSGGSALIIDYGGNQSFGSSVRAFKNHKIVDVFESPGQCDMTANVDFAHLKEAMDGAASTHGPLSQRDFLLNMGFSVRLSKLLSNAKDNGRVRDIQQAAQRLIDPVGMGRQYQVLGVTGMRRTVEGDTDDVWPFVKK